MSMILSASYLPLAAYSTCSALEPISWPAITFMKGASPWAFHSYSSACSGVAETVMQSTSSAMACSASRTPGNGPQPCTMSAMRAFTSSPQRIARAMVSDG